MYKLLNLQILKLNGYHMILGDGHYLIILPKLFLIIFSHWLLKHFLPI